MTLAEYASMNGNNPPMTQEQIAATKDAIEMLRQALVRLCEGARYGVGAHQSAPLWSAANYLMRSLPREERL